MRVIQDLDEARHATFGRGVAPALTVARGHHDERRLADEGLDGLRQGLLDFVGHPLVGVTELLGEWVIQVREYGCHAIRLLLGWCTLLRRWYSGESSWRHSKRWVYGVSTPRCLCAPRA